VQALDGSECSAKSTCYVQSPNSMTSASGTALERVNILIVNVCSADLAGVNR
jgi:hypothetical protein